MTWPFEASTTKSLPRNLCSVLDLVGDSTMTRFLPAALLPAASSAASSTGSSASAAFARVLRLRRAAGATALAFTAALRVAFFFEPGADAAFLLVRDFDVAMRSVSRAATLAVLHRDPRRHLACQFDTHRPYAAAGQEVQHPLELLRIERALASQVEQVAPCLRAQGLPFFRA